MIDISNNIRQAVLPSSVFLFIICGLSLVAIVRYYYSENLKESFQAIFNYRQALRLFDEQRESDKQEAMFSNILFSLATGIYISLIFPFFQAQPLWGSYEKSILFFSFATGLLFAVKAMIWKMFGVIFVTQEFSKLYIYNMYLHNRITGFVIFPFVAIMPYVSEIITQYIVYGVIIVFILAYLLKICRIFAIIHTQNVSNMQFILYLCALEILPLLLFAECCKTLSESIL